MAKVSLADIMELSIPERILLVEDVWDSIAAAPEAVELTQEQRAELDRRMVEFHENPTGGSPWEEVKQRVRSKIARAE